MIQKYEQKNTKHNKIHKYNRKISLVLSCDLQRTERECAKENYKETSEPKLLNCQQVKKKNERTRIA